MAGNIWVLSLILGGSGVPTRLPPCVYMDNIDYMYIYIHVSNTIHTCNIHDIYIYTHTHLIPYIYIHTHLITYIYMYIYLI